MEAIRQIVRIPGNHELKIKVPDYLDEDDMVEVILLVNKQNDFKAKIDKMKRAAFDPMFLEDKGQVERDFVNVDNEVWE